MAIGKPRISIPAYPGRCVLDVGSTVVLLGMGQGYRLKNLPCVNIFCIGDGYGMLYTWVIPFKVYLFQVISN